MRDFLILFAIFSTAFARPDVSQGYRYEKGGGDNFIGEVPFRNGYNYGQQGIQFDSSLSSGISTNLGATIGINSGSGFNTAGSLGTNSLNFGRQRQNLAPIITKNFYLHSAPEENDQQQQVRTIQLGRAQKSYRVVFIKAPSPSSQSASIQAVYPKNEEKTIIYVLSKKADDIDIGDIATPAPSLPSKPEVFFIKYKTAEEAANAQQQIKAQYDSLGGTSQVSDEGIAPISSVIGSVDVSSSSNSRTDFSNSVTISPIPTTLTGKGTYLPPSK